MLSFRFPAVVAAVLSAVPFRAGADSVELRKVWEAAKVVRPVTVVVPPDGTRRQFLVQQTGQVRILPTDRSSGETRSFLDISDRKMAENDFEEGLIGLVFHPGFPQNRRFIIHYSQQNPKRSVISEMLVSATDPDRADLSTERILLEIPDPYWNHNCGNLLFGPDGFLYFGMGDGGKGNDPLRTAQNLFELHGKILRIDVDSRTGARAYGIPKDNPLVGREAAYPEIWAWGLRNPWGMYIDPETGLFWCADVGQDLWEEVNLIRKGGNYGWSWREGTRPFVLREETAPEGLRFIEPVHEYPHTEGTSVTGGFVYKGSALPTLRGAYVYGDYGSGRIWALRYDQARQAVTSNDLLVDSLISRGQADLKPTAFCEDADREILVLDWNGGIRIMIPKAAAP